MVPPAANPFAAPSSLQPFGQGNPSGPIGGPLGGSGNLPPGMPAYPGGSGGSFGTPPQTSPFQSPSSAQGPFPTLNIPPSFGSTMSGFGAPPPNAPKPPAEEKPPIGNLGNLGNPGNPTTSGNSSGFVDRSGIVSTYEDMAKDDSFKTKKLPRPNEKKKGFFDGLFKKDK
jgi:hypothetical protein